VSHCDWQRPRDPRRPQEQVVEAARAGGKPPGLNIARIDRRQIALDTRVARVSVKR
jgi:hypothetical protein